MVQFGSPQRRLGRYCMAMRRFYGAVPQSQVLGVPNSSHRPILWILPSLPVSGVGRWVVTQGRTELTELVLYIFNFSLGVGFCRFCRFCRSGYTPPACARERVACYMRASRVSEVSLRYCSTAELRMLPLT